VALFLFPPAFGQIRSPAPQPAPAPVTPAPTAPTAPSPSAPIYTNPSPTAAPNTPTLPQEPLQQLIYLTGRVVSDDGAPLGDTVRLETVCNGAAHTEGYADKKGNFSLRLGDQNSGVLQDASVGSADDVFSRGGLAGQTQTGASAPGPSRRLLMMNCQLQARLPGYRSDAIDLTNRRPLDNPNVGTIFLHRLGPVEGSVVSAASLAAPKDARKAFEKGQQAMNKRQPEEAGQDFAKAAQLYPGYATAWFQLGEVQIGQRRFEDAHRSFDSAIQADPKYLEPYLGLSALEAVQEQWPQLAETTSQALRLDPYDYPQAYFLNAMANYNIRNMDAAEKSAREAEKLDSQGRFPKSWQLLGMILADRREFTEAAEQMRGYLKFAPQASDADAVRARLAQIEALSGNASAQTQPR